MRLLKNLSNISLIVQSIYANSIRNSNLISNCSDHSTCTDSWDCNLDNDVQLYLKPEMDDWSLATCTKGLKNNELKNHEQMWFDNCCRTCCGILGVSNRDGQTEASGEPIGDDASVDPWANVILKMVDWHHRLSDNEKWASCDDVKYILELKMEKPTFSMGKYTIAACKTERTVDWWQGEFGKYHGNSIIHSCHDGLARAGVDSNIVYSDCVQGLLFDSVHKLSCRSDDPYYYAADACGSRFIIELL